MDRGNRFAVPSKERRDVMLQKFFENIFDVELYCQMVDLILRLSENTNREQAYREFQDHALFFSCPEQGVEERYSLHYPGEVLERLEEKMEVKVEQLRSLGLALAETRKFQNAGMFVGKQKASFWKKFRRILAKNDIYMMGILYLCDDKEKPKLYQKMCNCPIQELQELLFMLHMFVYDDEFWETRKHDLNQLLGTERNFSVYAYKEVYIWLTEKFSCKLKNYHKKDIEVLKYLFRLPCSYAKEGSTARKKLLEAGYSKREIMFLSMTLLFQTDLYTKLKIDGMTAERMAVETCLLFLSGQEDYSQEAYELCRTLFEKYRYFPVRLEGENGIMDYLYYRLEVQNIKTYQLLYECDNYRERHSNWFLIDLTDTKWHELKQILTPDAFENWVLETLQQNTYTSEQFKQYLSAYFSLTGEEITEMFWKRKNYTLSLLFPQFVELGHLDPQELLGQYLNEAEIPKKRIREKWFYMVGYLQNYINGLSSPRSYEMFMKLITSFGISNHSSMFEIEKLLWDSIGMKSDWRNQLSFFSLDFIRPFLSVEEHQELFRIIEQHIFHEYTESYVDFLVRILSDTNNFLWFEREEAKQLFHRLEPCLTDGSDLENLRRIYLTEQEISVLEEQKKKKEVRHQEYKQLMVKREIRKEFNNQISLGKKKNCLFGTLQNYISGYSYRRAERQEKYYITKQFLFDSFKGSTVRYLKEREIQGLLKVLSILWKEKFLEFIDLKKIVDKVEVEKEEEVYEAA